MEWLERLDDLPRIPEEQLSGLVLYGTQLRCVGFKFLAVDHVLTVQCHSSRGLLIIQHLDWGRPLAIGMTTRTQKHCLNT
jgi:hypothetical protein